MGLMQCELGALQLVDISGRADEADRSPGGVAHRDAMLARPVPCAVVGTVAIVALEAGGLAPEVRDQRRIVLRQVFRMDPIAPVFGGRIVVRGRAEGLVKPIGIEDLVVGDVPVVDAFIDRAHRDVVALAAPPQFPDQARVLERDDRLGRKALQQLDLSRSEGPHLRPEHREGAENVSALHQRHCHVGARAAQLHELDRVDDSRAVLGRELQIRVLHGADVANHPLQAVGRLERSTGEHPLRESGAAAALGDGPQHLAFVEIEHGQVRVAETRRALQDDIEYPTWVAGGCADGFEDRRGRGLLRERVGEFLRCRVAVGLLAAERSPPRPRLRFLLRLPPCCHRPPALNIIVELPHHERIDCLS